jgi:serine/threonine protein kinase
MVMFKREKGHSGESIENIKIIDFGLADHQSELDKADHPHGIAGTPNYIAPEIILANKPSAKSDIFSIGSILYFLYILLTQPQRQTALLL